MNSTKNDPFQFMLSNIEIIMIAINKSKTSNEAWTKLSSQLSNLKKIMKFNTFKVYSKILIKISFLINDYNKRIVEFEMERSIFLKDIDEIMLQKSNLKQQLADTVHKEKKYLITIEKVKRELDKVRHELDKKNVEYSSIKEELDKVRQESGKVRHELDKKNVEYSSIKEELDKIRHNFQEKVDENHSLKNQLCNALKENEEIKLYAIKVSEKLDKVTIEKSWIKENSVKKNRKYSKTSESKNTAMESNKVPKRINGWGVQFKWPYYRLFKKIHGKVRWIYIGKNWNDDLVVKKIDDFQWESMENSNGKKC